MTKRKLANRLTKMEGGKSQAKNHEILEALDKLTSLIAEEIMADGVEEHDGMTDSVCVLVIDAKKKVAKIIKDAKKYGVDIPC